MWRDAQRGSDLIFSALKIAGMQQHLSHRDVQAGAGGRFLEGVLKVQHGDGQITGGSVVLREQLLKKGRLGILLLYPVHRVFSMLLVGLTKQVQQIDAVGVGAQPRLQRIHLPGGLSGVLVS